MNGFAPMYGRQGPTAGGDPQVAELLSRTIDNQHKTTLMFEATVRQLQVDGFTPWTAPIPTMAITHAQWLAAMLWQAATSYLDGVVVAYGSEGVLPKSVYEECDSLCDAAGKMTMQAITLQSEMDHGSKPLNATLVSLPDLKLDGPGHAGVWCVFEAIYLQVVTDLIQIEKQGINKRMHDVYQTAKAALKPKADVFGYLQSSWSSSMSLANQKQLIREALPVISEIFTIGQQLWTPYLLGQVYVTALRYKPTLDDLELGFDPWCLTDPAQKRSRETQKESREELTKFWESVADPAAAYQMSELLKAALLTKRIRYRSGRAYKLVPWQSQYLVRFPVQMGTRSFNPGDLITLYASEADTGKYVVEVRKSGRANGITELLGQYK